MLKVIDFNVLDIKSQGLWLVPVDSDTAQKMLSYNLKNRRMRASLVKYIKQNISSGQWRSDHPQPVVFSNDGRLIDGQHRLTAILESNITKSSSLLVRVETGANYDVREYMDTGIVRALEDRVTVVDDLIFNRMIAQLVAFEFQIVSSKSRPSPDDLKEFYEKNFNALNFVYSVRGNRRDKASNGSIAYAAMQYFNINQQKATEFYTDVFVAAGDIKQAQLLRDSLTGLVTGGRTERKDCYMKAVGCMKAHLNDRAISRIVRASSFYS